MSNESPLQRRGMHRRIAARADPLTSIGEPIIKGPTIGLPGTSAPPTSTATSNPPSSTSTPPTSSTTLATSSSPTSDTSAKTSSAPATSAPSSSSKATSSSASSTSSSTSSSSSTSTHSSSTSSLPTSKASTSVPVTALVTTPAEISTHLPSTSTYVQTVSLASYAPGPSASQTVAASGGVSTGTVIGGVAAGVIGIAGIMFAIFYFLKRGHNDDEPIEDFNAMAFKRQSVIMPDDNTLSRGPSMRSIGYNNSISLPPPSMMRDMAQPSPTFSAAGPYMHNFAPQPSFAPGQYMNVSPAQGYPNTPNSANPFLDRYGAPPSPYTPAHGYAALNQPPLVHQPSSGAQFLTRQPSSGASTSLGDSHAQYVDLQRSSVTPYQAAQYAEISARLGTQPPVPLSAPDAQEIAHHAAGRTDSLPSYTEGENSFTQGRYEKPLPPPEPEVLHEEPEEYVDTEHALDEQEPQLPDLPAPSPAFSATGHSRVPSKPPTLPEISARPFSPVTAPFATSSPVQSPLSNSFTAVARSPPAHVAGAPDVMVNSTARREAAKATADPSKRETTYTIYDEEDAYGGI